MSHLRGPPHFDLSDSKLSYAVETIWAEPVEQDKYRLRNVPYFANEVSEQDIVMAIENDGQLHFKGVVERGGHSTYRIFLAHPVINIDKEFIHVWAPLAKLGCTYEKASNRLIGIDVPPTADIYAVYAVLTEGEQSGHWEFEEGHCGHPLRS